MFDIDKSVRHEFYLPINSLLTKISSRLMSLLFSLTFLFYPMDNIRAETLNNAMLDFFVA
ncbi:hypothetical protein SAMN02583745_02803 [Thorsellia anophelis DSM 18579]|uniref:Uncharacterized protein n=1 Tax=Thorsellia anophelis DSM 18579 TaxID=1123402 RepID=A0A1I0FKD6_9GAMM|nr:hypothetical protein SAMN02583745_02803 [Thorsellia anophelis DSM 18579]